MAVDTCATCGGPLPARAGRRGRSSVYCSAACRQKAYRERQDGGGGLEELIESVGRQAGSLVPRPASALYAGVTELSASVARLRRIARLAQETRQTTDHCVTEPGVTENPGSGAGAGGPVCVTGSPVTQTDTTETDATPFDESAFAALTESYRREIRAHCYRMTGSYDDAEDLVQETFLRAWRGRDGYRGRASARTWLYRIATNACLDFQRRTARRPQAYEPLPGMDHGNGEPPARITWLQPYPDDELPDSAAESRETVELVLLAALQHLPGRQRAALVLRDLLGLTAAETAQMLGTSVASVNSALQRARPALRERLPASRTDWTATPPTDAQRAALQRYVTAAERLDFAAMAELLAEDVTLTMPPNPFWFTGREALLAFLRPSLDPASPMFLGHWRHLPARANGQLAAGGYVRRPGTNVYRAQVLDVLRFDAAGRITEITSFEPHLFPAFGLPLRL
ncbi:sigma-70 family RNA polymerase sigma factor [Streptomyces barringtoniae]|uniref:sigma-70 family RNA polymerase sigma factor n=1 Tax=Streptomyces barringtoniae TaxID=2892029 RepID=UPI001E3F52E7|nr:RNA polymerase subunit sigma-70 [Streptomyces barringtoniae]MCC5480287.1 RNA polymerase subunit sigma-70 [Streptomyces barringtoniae]